MRYRPPTRRSTSAIRVAWSSPGANHFLSAAGSVQARKTFSRAALRVRVRRKVVSCFALALGITVPPSFFAIPPGIPQGRPGAVPRIAGSGRSTLRRSSVGGSPGGTGAPGPPFGGQEDPPSLGLAGAWKRRAGTRPSAGPGWGPSPPPDLGARRSPEESDRRGLRTWRRDG